MADFEQHVGTANLVFGTVDADMAGISLTGFVPRNITFDSEPEVFATATNGEGQVEAVAISVAAKRMVNCSVTGYITSQFTLAVGTTFTARSRFFIVKKISEPRKKGEYIEVTMDAVSYARITS